MKRVGRAQILFQRMVDAEGCFLILRQFLHAHAVTGSAHQDAFDDLAEREAEEIAACLNAALFDPLLDQWHPGQPHLVEFVMRRPDSANASGAVANLAALAAAGYRVPVEKVAELVGYEVTDAAAGTSAGGIQPPGTAFAANMQRVERRWQPLMKYAPARAAFAEAIKRKVDAARAAEAAEEERKKPLTERELEALERVGKLRVADLMRADAATLEQGMTDAVERVKGKPAVSLNQCNQHAHDEGCDGGSSSSPSSDTSPKPEADDGKEAHDEPSAESKTEDSGQQEAKSSHPDRWENAVYSEEVCRPKAQAFYAQRPAIQKQVQAAVCKPVSVPSDKVKEATIGNNNVKKMLCNTSVWASLRNGVEPDVHVESVERIHELLPKGKARKPKKGTLENDDVDMRIKVDSEFRAKDGNDYIATYTIHSWKQKGMKPCVYTVNCARKPK